MKSFAKTATFFLRPFGWWTEVVLLSAAAPGAPRSLCVILSFNNFINFRFKENENNWRFPSVVSVELRRREPPTIVDSLKCSRFSGAFQFCANMQNQVPCCVLEDAILARQECFKY